MEHVAGVVKKIKDETGLHICACLGLLKPHQAERLAEAGVDRINHNLNTSRGSTTQICTTHTYQDRLDTLKHRLTTPAWSCARASSSGWERSHEDIVDVVQELQTLNVASIPVNFLIDIDGTPLKESGRLTPQFCLKVLCLLRLAHPDQGNPHCRRA